MSTSLFLYLDAAGNANFDQKKIRDYLHDLQGVSNWREGPATVNDEMLFDCVYEFKQDSTTIFVPKDLSFISIWGTGDASFQAALEIQKRSNAPIYIAVSESPENVVNLSTVSSLQELKERLKR